MKSPLDAGQRFLEWVLAQTPQTTPHIAPGSVLDLFAELGWRVQPLPQAQGVRWRYRGRHGSWWCLALQRGEWFTCYSRYPQAAQPEQLVALSELITRMNYGLALGNWELDWRDGELRFKTSLDVQGLNVDAQWLKRFLASHLGTFDHYWSAVEAVLTQGITPVIALERVEQLPGGTDLGHSRDNPD